MQGEKFVTVYDEAQPIQTPETPLEKVVAPLDEAAHVFGEWTHAYLSQAPAADGSMNGIEKLPGADRSPKFDMDFRNYFDWVNDKVGGIRSKISSQRRTDRGEVADLRTQAREGLKTGIITEAEAEQIRVQAKDRESTTIKEHEEAMRKYNWHVLNMSMAPLWKPLMDGEWPKPGNGRDKFWWIERAQEGLAVQNMRVLQVRHQEAINDPTTYFGPENGRMRAFNEGLGAEYEDAILLLEVVKQAMLEDPSLELTVIPASPQFESSDYKRIAKERGHEPINTNADFLIINLRTHEVVGWQSKTRLQERVVNSYDTAERLVMSSTIDNGNVVRVPMRRMENGREVVTERTFPWIGGLAVQKALELPTYGPDVAVQSRILFGDDSRGFNKSGNYANKTKPQTGNAPSNVISIVKHFAREISEENHFDTDWVTEIQHAAQRPEVIEALKRVGCTPKPNGFFYEAA